MAWAKRLVAEYQLVVFTRKLDLALPNMEIGGAETTLGSWKSTTRTLTISARLIDNHSWDVVVEILKHEMAHQYLDEVSHSCKGKPHGPEFQHVCTLLGVHPDYRGATASMAKMMQSSAAAKARPCNQLEKIKKLLALAESANENEASVAMERANYFISKYNIDMVTKNDTLHYDYLRVGKGQKRIPAWTKLIGALLRDYFFVRTITVEHYDAKTDTTSKVIELIGNSENLAVAAHVYTFLHERLALLWSQHQAQTGVPGREKRSYFLGVLAGFREKMQHADRKNHAELLAKTPFASSGELVVATDEVLNRFFTSRYPRVVKRSSKMQNIYADSYHSGREDGRKINIYKPVVHNDANLGRQLR